MVASNCGSSDIVDLLLEAGARVNIRSEVSIKCIQYVSNINVCMYVCML